MQTNLFDQHYIGQLIIQCWLKTLSLVSEDKNDAESRKCCRNNKNIEIVRNSNYIGIKGTSVYLHDVA